MLPLGLAAAIVPYSTILFLLVWLYAVGRNREFSVENEQLLYKLFGDANLTYACREDAEKRGHKIF